MEIASVYTEFRQALLRYIRSKIRSSEDAQDILQNVFTRITTNADLLSNKENIQHWLFTVTRNAVIDYYRVTASKKNISFVEGFSGDVLEEETTDTTQGLDQCVSQMIKLLPEEYRAVIIDSELNGIKQKDLAQKYNMPYSSLRSRVQRGRERLKDLFYECCHIKTDALGNILSYRPKTDCNSPCSPPSEK